MTTTYADTGGLAHGELVDVLDGRVREIVRCDAVEPQRDASAVRRIAEGVVRDHGDRSLTGEVAPLADANATVGESWRGCRDPWR